MSSLEYDFHYFKAGVEELEQYLLSGQLDWPLDVSAPVGEEPYPRLTPGELLLVRAKVSAQITMEKSKNNKLLAEIDHIEKAFTFLHTKWRVNWGKKGAQDFSTRLSLWRNYIGDYRKIPDDQAPFFPYEVRSRVILQLLIPEALDIPLTELELLKGLDSILNSILVPGSFIWESSLEAGFPKNDYWYLYGHPVT